MKILVDNREKNSPLVAEIISLGIEVEFRHLVLGDYIISEEIAIERKTIYDFVSSMINKRLILQLLDLKKNFKKPLLLIEGVDGKHLYGPEGHSNINDNAIRGMLLSILIEFQIPVIFAKDYEDAASYISLLAKKEERGEREFSFRIKRKAFNMKEQQQMIIEGFPGIGPSLAKNILKQFKTIPAFSTASLEELEKVPRLGRKKAVIVKALLDKKY